MVLNIGLLKSGQPSDYEAVFNDIHGVVELAHHAGAIVTVILETCCLTFEEKLRAADIALSAGADCLQTSTGFAHGGATADDIAILRGVAGNRGGVKATGGIRSLPRSHGHAPGRIQPHRGQLQHKNRLRTSLPLIRSKRRVAHPFQFHRKRVGCLFPCHQ